MSHGVRNWTTGQGLPLDPTERVPASSFQDSSVGPATLQLEALLQLQLSNLWDVRVQQTVVDLLEQNLPGGGVVDLQLEPVLLVKIKGLVDVGALQEDVPVDAEVDAVNAGAPLAVVSFPHPDGGDAGVVLVRS